MPGALLLALTRPLSSRRRRSWHAEVAEPRDGAAGSVSDAYAHVDAPVARLQPVRGQYEPDFVVFFDPKGSSAEVLQP